MSAITDITLCVGERWHCSMWSISYIARCGDMSYNIYMQSFFFGSLIFSLFVFLSVAYALIEKHIELLSN